MYVCESELLLGVITLFAKFLSGQLNDDNMFKVIVLTFRYAEMRPWKVGAAGEAVTAVAVVTAWSKKMCCVEERAARRWPAWVAG